MCLRRSGRGFRGCVRRGILRRRCRILNRLLSLLLASQFFLLLPILFLLFLRLTGLIFLFLPLLLLLLFRLTSLIPSLLLLLLPLLPRLSSLLLSLVSLSLALLGLSLPALRRRLGGRSAGVLRARLSAGLCLARRGGGLA